MLRFLRWASLSYGLPTLHFTRHSDLLRASLNIKHHSHPMNAIITIAARELRQYFATPLAYVFLVIFLVLSGLATFGLGSLYERSVADLVPFFRFHPWLYLFLIPAVTMRLWAEERKSGSIELLLTMPIRLIDATLGKFFAAWIFMALALALTAPVWLTVNYLGNPDNGIIFAAYIGSWLMAGAFLAVGSCISASSSNQVIAFIVTAVVCFLFLMSGFPLVLDFFSSWAPQLLIDAIASLSFLTHFDSIARGVLSLRDLLYFVIMIVAWLSATAVVINMKKS